MTDWELPTVAAGDVAGWQGRLRGIAAAYPDFAVAARRVAKAEHLAAERHRERERQRAQEAAAASGVELRHTLLEALRAARTTALRRFADLAPGLAGLAYAGPEWASPEFLGVAAPQNVRVGTISVGGTDPSGGPLPVAAALLPTAGWAIDAGADEAAALIVGTVLRVVAATPPYRVRVDSFDPSLTGLLGAFGALHRHTAEVVTESMTRPEPLLGCLADLADTASRRGARLNELGSRTFQELVAAAGPIVEPYRLLVLLDYPAGIDARAQRELVRVAQSAPERGLCLVVHHNAAVTPQHDVDPNDVLDKLCRFTARDDRWEIAGLLPGGDAPISCRRDPGPDQELCGVVSDLVGRAAASAALPAVGVGAVLPPAAERLARVQSGRSAELRADIGTDGLTPATVRLRSSDPPMPNLLVGGAVGQGKSNLLHVLIHGLAARYAPEDLEMYLLDFKQGLEFSILGPGPGRPHWLPHARVLGVFADREFGLAVLRHIDAELVRRGALFKRLGNVADIASLPPDNPQRPPRILLVLDEFQVMLAADDDISDEAAALLEKLVRLGRAFGLHVVLATQTLEGIPRLATKRDAIFGQVPYRIVLKTTAADSQSMLQAGNTAAAALRFRGQAVLNENFGAPEANRQVLVAYADQDELDRLRRELWQRAGGRRPRVFELDAPADLVQALAADRNSLAVEGEVARAWVGLPVGVDEHPVSIEIRPEPGAGLLLLGDDAPTALGVLSGLAVSLAIAARDRGDRFVVLDLLPGGAEATAGRAALLAALRGLGHPVEVVDRHRIAARLFELRDLVRGRTGDEPPVHLFGLGMHRAVRLTATADGGFESPVDALREIAQDGAGVGVFTYGWWNRLKTCRDHLGYTPPIGMYLFLQHPLDGVKEVCGAFVRWQARPHRGLLHDGLSDEPRQVVTFQPLSVADATRLAEAA